MNLKLTNELNACFLCNNAPCQRACPHGVKSADILRALRLDNTVGARVKITPDNPCQNCQEILCEAACNGRKQNVNISIKEIINHMTEETGAIKKVDLATTFCGVHCENPFFLGSSVVGSNYDMVAKAFEMGWAGVSFKTIGVFQPEEVSPRFDRLQKEGTPFVGFKNIEQISEHTPEENLDFIRRLKKNYPTKVIIASIMGKNEAEWTYLAEQVEEAGADMIECNFSCPHMSGDGLGSDVGTNPELVRTYTAAVRRGTKLPILAKMTPNVSNMEIPARAAMEAGADGISAINSIKSVMNVNLQDFSSGPAVDGKSAVGGYSGKAVKPIALRFIHDMKKAPELEAVALSGMGGIETWQDAAEFIAMGCGNLQVTTAIMQYGYRMIDDLIEGLSIYLGQMNFSGVDELIGKALPNLVKAEDLNRHSICYPRFNRKECVSCGRCFVSCYDGGHQAISQREEDGQPILNAKKCVGCHLCALVCPTGAITPGNRVEKQ